MLKDRAATLLKIRPDELRMVTLVAALFLCIQAGQGIGENAAFALFLSRLDINLLPYMYMGLGGFVSIASLAYATSLSRFRDARVVVSLLAGSVILFLAEWAAIAFLGLSIYPILWLTTFGMSVILGTLLWTVAGEVCDARQAKRLFPLFTSVGILGSVLGNLLTGVFAKIAGTAHLIVLYAILLCAGFFFTRAIAGAYFKPKAVARVKSNLIQDMRAGFDFVRVSPLFRIIALSSILYSILFFTVDFPFSAIVSSRFRGDDASLAAFKGVFTSLTTAVTFLVSLLLANRVYTRLGIVNSVLIMPITYAAAFVLFFVSFTFGGAVIARFSQLVILGGLMSTAWNALFNVVPSERRGQVLAFNNGVPAQIGVVLSGLMIILSKQVLNTQSILLLGAFVALVSIYLTIRMRSAYGEALLSALRAGRTEVFSEEDEAFSGYQNDPAALQVILKELQDPKPHMRRLAVEMLARVGNAAAIPHLVERLTDPDPEVRVAATHALADLGATSTLGEIMLGLDDPADIVREETLAALPRLKAISSPELIRILERLLDEPNVHIAAHGAAVLLFLQENERAQSLLSKLLKDQDANQRHIALDALGHIAASAQAQPSFHANLIMDALNDPSPLLRRDAMQVASFLKDNVIYESLVERFADEDSTLRKMASQTLKQAWPEPRATVMRVIEEMDESRLDAALDSIPPGDPQSYQPVSEYVQREVLNIRELRTLVASLPPAGRAVNLLIETLRHRESLSEERLIKAVGVFGNPRALDLIRKSLNAGDAANRAAALEALETLGDREITQKILPLLDRGGVFQGPGAQKRDSSEVINGLLASQDYWLRALAARSIPELDLKEFVPALHELKSDAASLVQQAALDALIRMEDGARMKTLKTISTLERILLLREVPMFSRLSPEDLEQIAEIAEEQLYPDQAVICQEGEPGNTLFIIVSGSVEVIKKVDQQENILAMRGAGEFVGEMAILESAPRSATLRASGDVRVLVIEGEEFTAILFDRPEVAVSVLRHVSNRVRQLNEKVGMPVGSGGLVK
ncbi:MAG TPA: Npt1/Npt2 family nucleotide transporter [Anaerolineales bacterium]|nr:Npt1/Npt2 family nucleotide transporter [Anaerolineales bacterium]